MELIKKKKSVQLVFTTPDGQEHETQEAAEVHHLSNVLWERSAFKSHDRVAVQALAKDLIDAKTIVGPLLHMPKKRIVKTPEQKAAAKKAADDLAAKKKADAKAAKNALKSKA